MQRRTNDASVTEDVSTDMILVRSAAVWPAAAEANALKLRRATERRASEGIPAYWASRLCVWVPAGRSSSGRHLERPMTAAESTSNVTELPLVQTRPHLGWVLLTGELERCAAVDKHFVIAAGVERHCLSPQELRFGTSVDQSGSLC